MPPTMSPFVLRTKIWGDFRLKESGHIIAVITGTDADRGHEMSTFSTLRSDELNIEVFGLQSGKYFIKAAGRSGARGRCPQFHTECAHTNTQSLERTLPKLSGFGVDGCTACCLELQQWPATAPKSVEDPTVDPACLFSSAVGLKASINFTIARNFPKDIC